MKLPVVIDFELSEGGPKTLPAGLEVSPMSVVWPDATTPRFSVMHRGIVHTTAVPIQVALLELLATKNSLKRSIVQTTVTLVIEQESAMDVDLIIKCMQGEPSAYEQDFLDSLGGRDYSDALSVAEIAAYFFKDQHFKGVSVKAVTAARSIDQLFSDNVFVEAAELDAVDISQLN